MDNAFFQDPFMFDATEVESFFSGDPYQDTQTLSSSSSPDAILLDSPLSSPSREESFQPAAGTWLVDPVITPDNFLDMKYEPSFVQQVPVLPVQETFPMPYPLPVPSPTIVEHPVLTPSPEGQIKDATSEEDSEEDKKAKRPQKKRKLSTTTSVSSITKTKAAKQKEKEKEISIEINADRPFGLTRDELLTISSAQFEAYVNKLTEKRDLTSQEKSELKRQRRLIKNRESAQASRQRKKVNMEQLESKVQELENERQTLKEQVAALANANSRLEAELMYYRKSVSPNFVTDMVSRGLNYVNSIGKPVLPSSSNLQTASLVVMVVLFSFGLLFPSFLSQKALPAPLCETVPVTNARIFDVDNYKPVSQDKELDDIIAEQNLPLRRLMKTYKEKGKLESNMMEVENANSTPKEFYAPASAPSAPVTGTTANIVESAVPQKTTEPAVPEQALPPQTHQVSISNMSSALHFKPNTTYLFCQNVSQIVPPSSVTSAENSSTPPQITLIIPPDSLSSPVSGSTNNFSTSDYNGAPSPYFVLDVYSSTSSDKPKPSFLEVTCSVVDMNFLPLSEEVFPGCQ